MPKLGGHFTARAPGEPTAWGPLTRDWPVSRGCVPLGSLMGGVLGRTPPPRPRVKYWLAHKFTVKPSKYLRPLRQLPSILRPAVRESRLRTLS